MISEQELREWIQQQLGLSDFVMVPELPALNVLKCPEALSNALMALGQRNGELRSTLEPIGVILPLP